MCFFLFFLTTIVRPKQPSPRKKTTDRQVNHIGSILHSCAQVWGRWFLVASCCSYERR